MRIPLKKWSVILIEIYLTNDELGMSIELKAPDWLPTRGVRMLLEKTN